MSQHTCVLFPAMNIPLSPSPWWKLLPLQDPWQPLYRPSNTPHQLIHSGFCSRCLTLNSTSCLFTCDNMNAKSTEVDRVDERWNLSDPAVMRGYGQTQESREMLHFITCCDMQRHARTVTPTRRTDSGDIVSCPPSTPLGWLLNRRHAICEAQSQRHARENVIIVCSHCESHSWNVEWNIVLFMSLCWGEDFSLWVLSPHGLRLPGNTLKCKISIAF